MALKNIQLVNGINLIDSIIPTEVLCEAYINGKQTRLPFEKIKGKYYIERSLLIFYSNICGLITYKYK